MAEENKKPVYKISVKSVKYKVTSNLGGVFDTKCASEETIINDMMMCYVSQHGWAKFEEYIAKRKTALQPLFTKP